MKGPYQCYYMSLYFVIFDFTGYMNTTHFSQNSFINEILRLFTFCPYSKSITESTWKCVTTLVKKTICVKILLHANIWARKAALVRNYFPKCNNFHLNSSWLSLWFSDIDQINVGVPFRTVNYQCLLTFTYPSVSIPCFNMNGSGCCLKIQSEIC